MQDPIEMSFYLYKPALGYLTQIKILTGTVQWFVVRILIRPNT